MGGWTCKRFPVVTALVFLCIGVVVEGIGRWASSEAHSAAEGLPKESREKQLEGEVRHLQDEVRHLQHLVGEGRHLQDEEKNLAGTLLGELEQSTRAAGAGAGASKKAETKAATSSKKVAKKASEALKDRAKEKGEEGESKEKGEEGHEEQESAEGGEEEREGEPAMSEEEREEEEEAEEFTPLDLTCAIWLLALVSFNMSLFYFVNWPDPEMRIYVWTVISTTISIFIAIFIFACTDLIIRRYLSSPDAHDVYKTVLAFGQLTVWFIIMQVAVASVSGALEEHPFIFEKNEDDPDSIRKRIDKQKLSRRIRFKSVATLCAHITGFAAINAGGYLQHMYPFNSSAAFRFSVPAIMLFGQLIVSRTVRAIRSKVKSSLVGKRKQGSYAALKPLEDAIEDPNDECSEPKLVAWCLEQWDEETYESEIDVAGLAISFLLVQACRYHITGVMPNNMGIEEPPPLHPLIQTYEIAAIGLAFACLAVVHVVLHSLMPEKQDIPPGTLMSTLLRMVLIGQNATATAFAWCCFVASKWEIARALPQFNPNGVVSRVLLASAVCIVVFIVILLLDRLADMECTGEVADRAIVAIIYALSTLVGFSFEQSFDGAVEALADLCFKEHKMEAELVLATVVCIIVYPAWRKHILKTLINLRDEYQEAMQQDGTAKTAIQSELPTG